MLALAGLFLLAGCNSNTASTPENFIKAINAHFYDHPDCLFPQGPRFPFETSDPAMTRQMDALVKSLLLSEQQERGLHVSRYTPTEVGARVAPRFCYGHRIATSIESSTPVAQANGFPETQVVYHYTMEEVPVWAKSQEVQGAFPAMAHATSGTATDKATLARTMSNWQVPD